MKMLFMALAVCILTTAAIGADIKVVYVRGDIQVRRGVSETWQTLAKGDILKPEDSMKSGKRSSVAIMIDGKKKIVLPELAIVDCSDLRELSQEELMLMLAMETIRSVPAKKTDEELIIPRTTTVHGENKNPLRDNGPISSEIGILQLNGTKVLHDQGFYATCVLKAKEVFRRNQDLLKMVSFRLVVADALEQMKLNGDALSEYNSLLGEQLSQQQRVTVEQKIGQLHSKNKE